MKTKHMPTPQKEQQLREDFKSINDNDDSFLYLTRDKVDFIVGYWLARMHELEEELVKKIEKEIQNSYGNPEHIGGLEAVLKIINPKHE